MLSQILISQVNKIVFPTLFLLSSTIFAQHVVINEFLASNDSINVDPDYQKYSDWIEIYNAGNSLVDLSGYYLTDNLDDSTKWQIPDNTFIKPGDFILFWADGKDATGNSFHTNFKLQKSGEEIGLYSPNKTLIDYIVYDDQMTDISFGRQPDGSAVLFLFSSPTPNRSNSTEGFLKATKPKFSLKSGFYTEAQILKITTNSPNGVIHYTLNGNEPTKLSPIYSAPLSIQSREGDPNVYSLIPTNAYPFMWLPDWVRPKGEIFKATIVRVRVFELGKEPSEIFTKTYFVDPNIHQRYATIPVMSLVSDYKHLYDRETGIYVPGNTFRRGDNYSGNYFQDWERPAHVEFFEIGGKLGFSEDVGIKIQGGTSPASPLKGLHVIARSKYGNNRIEYPIFKDSKAKAKNLNEFKRFIIRGWGSLISGTMFSDAFAHRIFEHSDLDIQAYRPVVVFINGEYWGLQEIREENKNSWYYQAHYGIDRNDPGVDILVHKDYYENPYPVIDEGDVNHWNEMMDFVFNHDLSIDENYEYIKNQMDVDNFILYMGHCIFVGKWDWPRNNEASWRPKTPEGKWKWIQYDMEAGFGVAKALSPEWESFGPQVNMLQQVINGLYTPENELHGPHHLFVKLLDNKNFKQAFIDWFYYHLDHELSAENLNSILDEMVAEIEPYMEEYWHRWPFKIEFNNDWYYGIEIVRDFINNRAKHVKQHLKDFFENDEAIIFPEKYYLFQNYPNPFINQTVIEFYLPKPSKVSIKIYDLLGRFVRRLSNNQALDKGTQSILWDGKDNAGYLLCSGTYFYKIEAGNFYEIKKTLIIR